MINHIIKKIKKKENCNPWQKFGLQNFYNE